MAGEQLSPYALTTLQRVKDLLFDPNLTINLTGCVLNSSTDVTAVTVPAGKVLRVGQTISGTYIQSGTTIAAIVSTTEITLSKVATGNASGQILAVIDQPTAFDAVLTRLINWATNYINNECGRFSFVQQTYTNEVYSIDNPRQTFLVLRNSPVFSLTSFQWRAGTPSNPNWTDFIADQYELIDPVPNPSNSGALFYPKGIIRVYGVLPRIYSNMIRATYTGGYPVNWANPEDQNTHMLPGDITGVCENLVVRRFIRRQLAGKSSQALEGATITWRNDIDAEDLDVLGQYRDLHF
jgi:hypothetical protein